MDPPPDSLALCSPLPLKPSWPVTSSIKCGGNDVLDPVIWKFLPLHFGEMAHCKKSDHSEAIMMMGSPPGEDTWKDDGGWTAPADVPGR